jgi:Outer membrane lipoprotein-sorting protein
LRLRLGISVFAASSSLAVLIADVRPQPEAMPATALPTLVQRYQERALGSPGLRRIKLELQSRGATTRTFTVAHGWTESAGKVSSVVLLDAPSDMRGTSYLWSEDHAQGAGTQIFLRLPAGKRKVLTVEASRFDEGLLGSDFAYADLFWRLPTQGRQFKVLGDSVIDGVPVTTIESRARPETVTPWPRVEYSFARDSQRLMSARFYDAQGAADTNAAASGSVAAPRKTLTVQGWREQDGVWAPSVMVMSRPGEQRSVLTLIWARYRTGLRPEVFDSANLGPLADALEASKGPAEHLLEAPK